MFDTLQRRLRLVAWSAAVLALAIIRTTLGGTPVSWPEVTAWLAVLVAPPAIVHQVFRGPQSSIAHVLYDTEHPVDARAGETRRVR